MNNVERLFLEETSERQFQSVVSDDFSFVDSLITQDDLDKFGKEEG